MVSIVGLCSTIENQWYLHKTTIDYYLMNYLQISHFGNPLP